MWDKSTLLLKPFTFFVLTLGNSSTRSVFRYATLNWKKKGPLIRSSKFRKKNHDALGTLLFCWIHPVRLAVWSMTCILPINLSGGITEQNKMVLVKTGSWCLVIMQGPFTKPYSIILTQWLQNFPFMQWMVFCAHTPFSAAIRRRHFLGLCEKSVKNCDWCCFVRGSSWTTTTRFIFYVTCFLKCADEFLNKRECDGCTFGMLSFFDFRVLPPHSKMTWIPSCSDTVFIYRFETTTK